MSRIGIFGGTFDPIHLGHLLLAEMTRGLLKLDRVLFVPANIPPHKGAVVVASPEHRFHMTDLACEDNPHFLACDLEIRRGGPSYTVETLRSLKASAPEEAEHYLIMGADSARDLESWKEHEVLLSQSQVVVLARLGVNGNSLPRRVSESAIVLPTPVFDISSTEIRRLVRDGESIRYMVADPVEKYIRSERLYVS